MYGFDGSRGGSCQLARRMENILCQARTAGVRRGEAKHGTHGRRQGGGGRNAAKRQELRAAPTSLVCVTSCSAEIVQVLEYAKCLHKKEGNKFGFEENSFCPTSFPQTQPWLRSLQKRSWPGATAAMMNPYHAICGATFLAFIPVPMRVALLAGASGGVLKYVSPPRAVGSRRRSALPARARARLTGRAPRRYNNVTPRMAMDDLKSKDKLSESQAALAQRLTGAQVP